MTDDVPEPALVILWEHIRNGINWELLYKEKGNLLSGASVTLQITLGALLIGLTLGLVLSILRTSRPWILRVPAAIYVDVFRCTPMTVQILMFYYGIFPGLNVLNDAFRCLPENFFSVSALHAGIAALGLNSAAYLCEIFRGGIQSVDRGQREAALSLGMRESQVLWNVVLPQAIANALPAMANEFITMIKDSSLLALISVAELTFRARQTGSREFESFTMYLGAGLFYFLICFPTSRFIAWLEKRMRVGSK